MATVHVQTFFLLKFLPSHRNNNLSAGVQSTLFSNAFVVIFMMMCHTFFWLCRPGTDMMTCAGKQTCLAAHSVGMPVSGSGYTWYDLAFGPCQCPLAWIPAVPSQPSLAGNKMYWDRGRGNHHCGMAWLSATLKDRLLAGPAWGCIVHQSTPHPGWKVSQWFLLRDTTTLSTYVKGDLTERITLIQIPWFCHSSFSVET